MTASRSTHLSIHISLVLSALLMICACTTLRFRTTYHDANRLLHETDSMGAKPYLKAHLLNGDVCIFDDNWDVDTVENEVSGNGTRYDYKRRKIYAGNLNIEIDSVAIFETNTRIDDPQKGSVAALALLASLDVALGAICISTPKACFGSCPTFYLDPDQSYHYADAEGFSDAVAPAFEYADIDALNNPPLTRDTFSLFMKNEALETHCVRNVSLLAFPREPGTRVYQSPGDLFFRCGDARQPVKAFGQDNDIRSLVVSTDKSEYFSYADENNLNSREELYFTFENPGETVDLGLILSFRQTLMTTYFIYSAMGYMGDEVSDVFAEIETGSLTSDGLKEGIRRELGAIDIYTWEDASSGWVLNGSFYETGPIAINQQMLPLVNEPAGSEVRVKIVLNKGLWRIDYIGLTEIKEQVSPTVIAPCEIMNEGTHDKNALSAILDTSSYLISMPGSMYEFRFTLPPGSEDYELFLVTRGYYLEWMRSAWIKDKNLPKLRQMLVNPAKYLEEEAATYKKYEQSMEQLFWDSRIDTKSFSYYAN